MKERTDIEQPKPNVELLRKTLKYIEDHPEEWRQESWHCGTKACFAGHAALLAGGTWAHEHGMCMLARDDDPHDHVWQTYDGTALVDVDDRAIRVLGVTEEQASRLFWYANSLDALRTEVVAIVGEDAHVIAAGQPVDGAR